MPTPLWLEAFDRLALRSLVPLAWIFLISGLDDLAIDVAWLIAWIRSKARNAGAADELQSSDSLRDFKPASLRKCAILVPLWNEHEVIARMLAHNLAAIRYPDYHVFVGAYPNDPETQAAVRAIEQRFSNVHLALCPHNGPTSKADCLNWIYQHIVLYEELSGESFDLFVTHDAEDLIHPEELNTINAHADQYGFIQIPVLALKTPFWNLTHGVYCDEFAEYHSRDMMVRSEFGVVVPGSGVGTGYTREALEKLAASASNRIFEPAALTEDYENGIRLHRLGCAQKFVTLRRAGGQARDFVATREFFPQTWRTALKQRTRWVTGIALQGWERLGWKGSLGDIYWLWRDRKGLIGNPLGAFANALSFYAIASAAWTRKEWMGGGSLSLAVAGIALTLQLWRLAVRITCTWRVYGFRFAAGVPLRVVFANALNAAATVAAVAHYASARLTGKPLRWLKTDHQYPTRTALLVHRRRLGEILMDSGYLTAAQLARSLEMARPRTLIGEHLVQQGLISEDELYEALSLQQGLRVIHLDADSIPVRVARSLPEGVVRRWEVFPYRISEGALYIAGPNLPSPEMHAAVRQHTSLEVRFCLTTRTDYKHSVRLLLEPEPMRARAHA